MSTSLKTVPRNDDSTLDRIRRYIKDPPENSRVFTITPDCAQALLAEFNRDNRPKKPTQIAHYAAHMRDDFWLLTGDTIKFSDKERLLDGQNRLFGCVRSNHAFSTHVVFGIGDGVFSMLDRGKNRSAADLLSIAGFTNTQALQAAIRWLYMIRHDRVTNRDTLEPEEKLRLVQHDFIALPDYAKPARMIYDRTRQPTGMVMALLYEFHAAHPQAAREYSEAWGSGQVGGRFRPLGVLQSVCAQIAADSSGRVHEVIRCALCIKAWNLFVAGRRGTMTELRHKLADEFPRIAR